MTTCRDLRAGGGPPDLGALGLESHHGEVLVRRCTDPALCNQLVQAVDRECHINIGTGKDISIFDLAYLVKEKVGFNGELFFNDSKPDGTMLKMTDVTKLHKLGWHHKIEIEKGIQKLYDWYTAHQ